VCVRLPFVPVTVNVNVARGVRAVLIVRTDVAPGVTEVGLNEPDDVVRIRMTPQAAANRAH
jgi:hypothetical protein